MREIRLAAALATASLIFGPGHSYQGIKGVIGTAVGWLFPGLLFLLGGNLIPAMVLHALLDTLVAFVLRPTSGNVAVAPLAAD